MTERPKTKRGRPIAALMIIRILTQRPAAEFGRKLCLFRSRRFPLALRGIKSEGCAQSIHSINQRAVPFLKLRKTPPHRGNPAKILLLRLSRRPSSPPLPPQPRQNPSPQLAARALPSPLLNHRPNRLLLSPAPRHKPQQRPPRRALPHPGRNCPPAPARPRRASVTMASCSACSYL